MYLEDKKKLIEAIKQYDTIQGQRAEREYQIIELKKQIEKLEAEDVGMKIEENELTLQIEMMVYQMFQEKDLLKMLARFSQIAGQDSENDLSELVTKFQQRTLKNNEIQRLLRYCEVYSSYNRPTMRGIRMLYNWLGGDSLD